MSRANGKDKTNTTRRVRSPFWSRAINSCEDSVSRFADLVREDPSKIRACARMARNLEDIAIELHAIVDRAKANGPSDGERSPSDDEDVTQA